MQFYFLAGLVVFAGATVFSADVNAQTFSRAGGGLVVGGSPAASGDGFSDAELKLDKDWPQQNLGDDRTNNAAHRAEELAARFRGACWRESARTRHDRYSRT